MGNDVRGDGTTTRQMKETPLNGVYVWCNHYLHYPRSLARYLGRSDLTIVSPDGLERLQGTTVTGVTFDHAVYMTRHLWDDYLRIRVVNGT